MENEKFEAEWKEINGKKVLMIKTRGEEIINPDGSKSVIIHAPSLSVIDKIKNMGGK